MTEARDISPLTRIALNALARLHQTDVETIAQAAAVSDGVPLADGWRLDVGAGRWVRDVPDDPSAIPSPSPSGAP